MTAAHDERGAAEEPIAPDLVQYLIVVLPETGAIAAVLTALDVMVASAAIRVLDVVVVRHAVDGTITASEIDAVTPLVRLGLTAAPSGMLSQHDIELAAFEVPPGTTGLVVVIEDRWAQPLSAAASRAGGRIVAGERIATCRVETVLAEASARSVDAL